ncbi:MAG: 5'/3'-nucleotidase SurE [Deltaproteobacteria bacterium]|nr:5'/3'-nucleotidase SurE [Deltaproteobacteria bacterium]
MTHVLLTNDDGISAPGLASLERCARRLFDRVTVVAPDKNRSGVGQGLTLEDPLRCVPAGEDRYALSGTPTDCVIVAMNKMFRDQRPDFVLSGVNRGPNLGRDVFYSGTVAAAREGLFHQVPSVALSLAGDARFPFEALEPAVERVLEVLVGREWGDGYLMNVNIPVPPATPVGAGWSGVPGIKGMQVTSLGERFYNNELIVREDPRGGEYIWLGGAWPTLLDRPGTDCNAVREGYISLTPVGVELTERAALDHWSDLEEGG